jgi:hypothetical protein
MLRSLWLQNGNDENVPCVMFDSQEMGCSPNPDLIYDGAAFSSYCTLKGSRFKEYSSGHGKMFIRPGSIFFAIMIFLHHCT